MPEITSDAGHVYSLGREKTLRDPRWVSDHALFVREEDAPDPATPIDISSTAPSHILDQDGEGSCTAHAFAVAMFQAAVIAGFAPVVISRMLCYYLSRVYIHTFPQDSGADIEDPEIVTAQNGGLPADEEWPYDGNPSETPPSRLASAPKYNFIDGQQPIAPVNGDLRPGILTALSQPRPLPVNIGFNVSQADINAWEQTACFLLNPGRIEGGHDVAVLGNVPHDPGNPATGARGLAHCRGSWDPNMTVARTDLVPSAIAGDLFIPWERFANGNVSDATAFVPTSTPAILTVTLSGPASAVQGAAAAFSVAVAGAPAGTVLQYTWDFGDGVAPFVTGSPTQSHTFAAAGSFRVTCLVTVNTTGAHAQASIGIAVAAGPNPTPKPVALPSDPFWRWLVADGSYSLGQNEPVRRQQAVAVRYVLNGFYPAATDDEHAMPPPTPELPE